jgi:hypothetical protein
VQFGWNLTLFNQLNLLLRLRSLRNRGHTCYPVRPLCLWEALDQKAAAPRRGGDKSHLPPRAVDHSITDMLPEHCLKFQMHEDGVSKTESAATVEM